MSQITAPATDFPSPEPPVPEQDGRTSERPLAIRLLARPEVGVFVALLVSLGIGLLNGWMVVKTGLPSFLVTLGSFLTLQGVNLAVTKLVTGNVATDDISNMDGFDRTGAATNWCLSSDFRKRRTRSDRELRRSVAVVDEPHRGQRVLGVQH